MPSCCLHSASEPSPALTVGLLHSANGTWRPQIRPNMRYHLPRRRISLKRSLASTALALGLGLTALPLAAKPPTPTSWAYLQPGRAPVTAALNAAGAPPPHH